MYVRFGGGFLETCRSNTIRRWVSILHSGERGKLLNHIASELHILRGIAYGMGRAMYWAKMNGIFRSLNPWSTWVNEDSRIANDVINNAKYLKQ
jgi:hypothetical protein